MTPTAAACLTPVPRFSSGRIIANSSIARSWVTRVRTTGGTASRRLLAAGRTRQPSLQDTTFNRNLYYGYTTALAQWSESLNIDFSTWQAMYRKDVDGLNGVDPQFVSAVLGNYRLQPGSPALILGRDVLDLNGNGSTVDTIPAGAYLTGTEQIGLLAGPADSVPPSAPTSLTVD